MCHKKHTNANPDYVNIGHVGLISDRDQFDVPLENAGTLGEYVPFYFGGHSPMLYMIMNGYSGVEKQPQSDIVYIICTVEKISSAGCEFVFTDRHAKVRIAKYYRSESDFDKIDWNAVKSKDWADGEIDLGRRDRKQAEFLVRDHVPCACISAIVVRDEEGAKYIEKIVNNLGLSHQSPY